MSSTIRPKRFILIPANAQAAPAAAPVRLAAPMKSMRAMSIIRHRPDLKVIPLETVDRSPADGSVLVEAADASIAQIQARAPDARVYEERWYPLQRRPVLPRAMSDMKAPVSPGQKARKIAITVRLGGATGRLLRDVYIVAMVDEAANIGVEAVTDSKGVATIEMPSKLATLEVLYVTPLHSGWPVSQLNVHLPPTAMTVVVPALDLKVADGRNLVYGLPKAKAGADVHVAVVDTGVGPHTSLNLEKGKNTTLESSQLTGDPDGHGTHVAGVIASRARGLRRGEASGVKLYPYRVFESGDGEASSFAISAAIKEAAAAGCHLINLSVGSPDADPAIEDAIEQAWNLGSVCLAAAGNDGVSPIDFPAGFKRAVGVSALGVLGSWPAGASINYLGAYTVLDKTGNGLFFASFSNYGKKVGITAPGVAIVSTIFRNRWGVMSGTSMATPVATGVVARLIATTTIPSMSPTDKRAERIVALIKKHAEDLGMPRSRQGDGLAR